MTRAGFVALAVVADLALAGAQTPQTIYRSRSDVVAIDVAVTDGRRPVLNLTAADFELGDNGVPQAVLDFERERQPLDLNLTIDVSGSMTPAERLIVQRAVDDLGRALGPQDGGSVVTFARGVTERMPAGPPPLRLDLTPISGDGMSGTAVIDALLLALVTPSPPGRRELALFMTDGEDNASYFDANTVAETVRHTTGQLSVVLARDDGKLPEGRMLDVFRLVTRATGGEILQLGRGNDLGKAFLLALENFRTSYVLRYTPAGVSPDGWHDVVVRVKGRNYTLRARPGYWAVR